MNTLLTILKVAPAVISLIREILKVINDVGDAFEKKKRAEDLKEAVKDAKEKKDTRKLEDFFGAKSSRTTDDSE